MSADRSARTHGPLTGWGNPKGPSRADRTAAAQVEEQHGALDVFWGDVYRLRYAGKDLPANGGPDTLGVFRVLNFDRDGETYRPRHGDTYVQRSSSPTPFKPRFCLATEMPASPIRHIAATNWSCSRTRNYVRRGGRVWKWRAISRVPRRYSSGPHSAEVCSHLRRANRQGPSLPASEPLSFQLRLEELHGIGEPDAPSDFRH